jgi:glutathione S-transferase
VEVGLHSADHAQARRRALTGGYRKTPFLQIGADMYCDSALIADVLEHLQPEPTLYPEPEKGLSRILAQWADTTLFWAAMAWNLQPKGAAEVFAKAPPEAAKAFGEDRGKMSAGNMTRLRPADATSAYKSYLRRLSDMLDDKPTCWARCRASPTSRCTTRSGTRAASSRFAPSSS